VNKKCVKNSEIKVLGKVYDEFRPVFGILITPLHQQSNTDFVKI
jgi:hypothetical protein